MRAHGRPISRSARPTPSFCWSAVLSTAPVSSSSKPENNRRLIQCCAAAGALGVAFLFFKFGIEWRDDFSGHLFPGHDFSLQGPLSGGARIFFVFYFLGTGLHGLHMLVGLILVGWIIWRASHGEFSAAYYTPVIVVGLYWSFVDIVWIVLYPLIYLVGRGP